MHRATAGVSSGRAAQLRNGLVASLFLVVRPGAPSSFLFLVAMPGAPSSVLVPSSIMSGATSSFLLLVLLSNIMFQNGFLHLADFLLTSSGSEGFCS